MDAKKHFCSGDPPRVPRTSGRPTQARRKRTVRKRIHLVCNAHLDPVWLWEWEEGAGEAIATFRAAAELCEKFPDFIFCHNEAVLYRWVEEHEPVLFRKIRDLVRRKRWHIMGGWYLQPDCNLPSGESFVRQILIGKGYFLKSFGVEPRTAVNLDPFGHTRGLVQILAKSGYRSYLCCRPGKEDIPLPQDEFIWVGFDGSEVVANRASAHYNSSLGKARTRLEDWLSANRDRNPALHLWGVGNHGGGPSRKDLEDLGRFLSGPEGAGIVHSTPDAYFEDLLRSGNSLPKWRKSLNPWAVGCYTSQARVKRKHRLLENGLFSAEKMITSAWIQGFLDYPAEELGRAAADLAFAEFHDILPGSSTEAGEEGAIRGLDHGLEIVSRLRAKAFFALAAGETRAKEGEIPILVFNPHPFPVRTLVECEFEPREPNFTGTFWNPRISRGGEILRSQPEKEASTLSVEWRKKVVFEADLAPSVMNRFDCRLETLATKPEPEPREKGGLITAGNGELEVAVNAGTGLVDRFKIGGRRILGKGAFRLLVLKDDADSWGMKVRSFRDLEGAFRLSSPREAALFSGLGKRTAAPVRVIEDGDIRTIVEAVFSYGKSTAVLRYKIPKRGTEVEVEILVFWAEKDRMLKISIPSLLKEPEFIGQVAFGKEELPAGGDEAVSQKWLALVSAKDKTALTVINDSVHGSDCARPELRISLLRASAYAADTVGGRLRGPHDRYIPRQDQGEHVFRLWVNAGPAARRMRDVDREALVRNEKPYALAYFPPGKDQRAKPGMVLVGGAVQVTAFKKAEDGDDVVLRVFEPTGRRRKATLFLPAFGSRIDLRLGGFEVKTLRFDTRKKSWTETDLLERPRGKG